MSLRRLALVVASHVVIVRGWVPQGKNLDFVHVLSLVNSTVNGFGRHTVIKMNTGGGDSCILSLLVTSVVPTSLPIQFSFASRISFRSLLC